MKAEMNFDNIGGGGINCLKCTALKTITGGTVPSFTINEEADICMIIVNGARMLTNIDPTTGEKLTSGSYYSNTDGTWPTTALSFVITSTTVSLSSSMSSSNLTMQLFYTTK